MHRYDFGVDGEIAWFALERDKAVMWVMPAYFEAGPQLRVTGLRHKRPTYGCGRKERVGQYPDQEQSQRQLCLQRMAYRQRNLVERFFSKLKQS